MREFCPLEHRHASLLSSVDDTNKTDSIMAEMSTVTKDLVAAMTLSTAFKQDDLMMRQHKKWMKMALFYLSVGQKDRALALMEKIEGDDEAALQSKSAGYNTLRGVVNYPPTSVGGW